MMIRPGTSPERWHPICKHLAIKKAHCPYYAQYHRQLSLLHRSSHSFNQKNKNTLQFEDAIFFFFFEKPEDAIFRFLLDGSVPKIVY